VKVVIIVVSGKVYFRSLVLEASFKFHT